MPFYVKELAHPVDVLFRTGRGLLRFCSPSVLDILCYYNIVGAMSRSPVFSSYKVPDLVVAHLCMCGKAG